MHSLQGFIATEDMAREFEHSFNEGTPPAAKSICLPQGFGLVPMTPALRTRLAEVTGEAETPLTAFSELTVSAMWVANMLSEVGKVVYVESDAQAGTQSATAWEFGQVLLQPKQTTGDEASAINEALKLLGVSAEGAADESAALGLSDHVSTEDWYKAALAYQLEVD